MPCESEVQNHAILVQCEMPISSHPEPCFFLKKVGEYLLAAVGREFGRALDGVNFLTAVSVTVLMHSGVNLSGTRMSTVANVVEGNQVVLPFS